MSTFSLAASEPWLLDRYHLGACSKTYLSIMPNSVFPVDSRYLILLSSVTARCRSNSSRAKCFISDRVEEEGGIRFVDRTIARYKAITRVRRRNWARVGNCRWRRAPVEEDLPLAKRRQECNATCWRRSRMREYARVNVDSCRLIDDHKIEKFGGDGRAAESFTAFKPYRVVTQQE